ncbi:hypothetical protein EVAR_79103_1 [Eumeta japonica]|uniref:Uncharacterized protein n=1 Tax=Eumeta variegata TaxID=151549 RepID=A0A4C1X3U2_EUMVA|nr:hypothetical protein EVAR_79103_1 [Eumeta japonica]
MQTQIEFQPLAIGSGQYTGESETSLKFPSHFTILDSIDKSFVLTRKSVLIRCFHARGVIGIVQHRLIRRTLDVEGVVTRRRCRRAVIIGKFHRGDLSSHNIEVTMIYTESCATAAGVVCTAASAGSAPAWYPFTAPDGKTAVRSPRFLELLMVYKSKCSLITGRGCEVSAPCVILCDVNK